MDYHDDRHRRHHDDYQDRDRRHRSHYRDAPRRYHRDYTESEFIVHHMTDALYTIADEIALLRENVERLIEKLDKKEMES